MRVWTTERPFDRAVWDFYRPGSRVLCGGGGMPSRSYRVVEREMTWAGAKATMRALLEPIDDAEASQLATAPRAATWLSGLIARK